MRWEKLISLIIIVALVIGGAYFAAKPIQENVKLGLDLKGGVQVRLQAKGTVTDRDIEQVMEVMRMRVDELGVTEPVIQKEGSNRVLIEIPGVEDPDKAIELIGKVAKLEFRLPDGTVVLDGSELKDAREEKDPSTGQVYVALEFKESGAKKFADVTTQLVKEYPEKDGVRPEQRFIAIYLDEELLQNPYVKEAIPSGKATIDGYESLEEARNIALLLRSGALPVEVEIIENRTIGPTLGADSINKSLDAAIWGLGAVFLFMLIMYRLPGIIANMSLVLYALLLMGALIALNATLTLPGIAGFLLSVGMCVDANIIIYERLKDELRNGKSLRAGVDAGFARAFWTIFDSNVTTLLAAAVLFYFGSGSIKGFAVTLSVGIICSMFTAITFTRFMLKLMVESGIAKNPKLYGA
ncbi:MAG TPA: protein translocase subunit SecD [Peptococcaceae bacterium]|jgi:preprotein translocase subunit SecD|nr:protein translocase subunit SecD [Peptococcaceae bacterium]HPZ70744.1 protein translocase subunit SecD [Peptococcaceae bacterium]HQD54396.1 protein translocase subunit SecD [Peptococcaceae bacterium]